MALQSLRILRKDNLISKRNSKVYSSNAPHIKPHFHHKFPNRGVPCIYFSFSFFTYFCEFHVNETWLLWFPFVRSHSGVASFPTCIKYVWLYSAFRSLCGWVIKIENLHSWITLNGNDFSFIEEAFYLYNLKLLCFVKLSWNVTMKIILIVIDFTRV